MDPLGTSVSNPVGTNISNPVMTAPIENSPPQIINFKAVQDSGNMWEFTGDVVDALPAGLTVQLGGQPVSLQGVTATTDANGHFDKIIALRTDGSDKGLASAVTTDAQGAQSAPVACYVNP